MFSAYKYLLYRIYQWQLAWFGEKQNPKFVAILGCSIFIYFNILTVIVIFEIIAGSKIYIENIYVVIFLIFLFSLNSYYFLHLDKFDNLIEEFSKETKLQRRRNTFWCFVYVIFTHLIFFLAVIIRNS